jgi:hypothetical protein
MGRWRWFSFFIGNKTLILFSTESSNHPVSPDKLVNWNVRPTGTQNKEAKDGSKNR